MILYKRVSSFVKIRVFSAEIAQKWRFCYLVSNNAIQHCCKKQNSARHALCNAPSRRLKLSCSADTVRRYRVSPQPVESGEQRETGDGNAHRRALAPLPCLPAQIDAPAAPRGGQRTPLTTNPAQ
jgi:hypothetical protein